MKKNIAWIDDVHLLTVIIDHINNSPAYHKEDPVLFLEKKQKYFTVSFREKMDDCTFLLENKEELPIGEELVLRWGNQEIPVYPRAIVRTEWFDQHYAAPEMEFGAICTDDSTIFTVWSPTATAINLVLNSEMYAMDKSEKGVWRIDLEGDWHGFAYEYEITINGVTQLVNDPYAKSMLANSKKGVVVNFSRADQAVSTRNRPAISNLQDAIIYELHVRDATIQRESGVLNRGKFLGLAEKDTATPNGFSTGLSYLKELGCTHVQLLPINDFARVDELQPEKQYNWGYDPLYFQVPEGSYSVLPEKPMARMNEFKAMIQAFHREGISVIIDVVYNHVFIMEESPFEKLVPGYYFRYHQNGQLSNGTGVGNDMATERKMTRKFILDTIDFMLQEYQVDGFRFDLMGAIDIETMRQIEARCKTEDTPIMLLGEGWDLPTAIPSEVKATSFNSHRLQGIRFFNDFFRDSIKGNLFNDQDLGYINGEGRFLERMPKLMSGSALEEYGDPFVSDVNQTVNYVECHDNHTLWDRLQLTNKHIDEQERKKMHQLATGIVLLSQGVPFIHAGQEWFRSKQGHENSYISGDHINQLDWNKRELEKDNIEFVKALIALRKKYNVFRMTSKQEIRRRFHVIGAPHPVFGFALLGERNDFTIYINPTSNKFDLHLPSSGKWNVAVTNNIPPKIGAQEITGEFTFINAYELLVLQKTRKPAAQEVDVVSTGTAF
ncbi:type I pullulanase [Oceanobacillus damuensis]|uniref:type I pullulanase n=1 Tax=Oceanobacillus damuensis TaxID=937928 RepID=UPI000834D200|nr:type I pullulanase [Oceanobacillus damuensis]